MSSPTEAIREQLMATNQEFQRLHEEHAHYAAQLDELASKTYLTEQEQLEEVRLKKLKLWTKDQMQMLVHRAQVA
ncbi:MAG TPA: YdcH family protein [Terriglobia bacterium]|nr:YdcH family protein [Terriglobia bacterium]